MTAPIVPFTSGRRESEVFEHLTTMRRLVMEARERIDALEACLSAIVVETTITVHNRKKGGARDERAER